MRTRPKLASVGCAVGFPRGPAPPRYRAPSHSNRQRAMATLGVDGRVKMTRCALSKGDWITPSPVLSISPNQNWERAKRSNHDVMSGLAGKVNRKTLP
jgi:hypothetical protein